MGLFQKKPTCEICGGKVGIFLPMRLGADYVCNACAEKIDLPDEKRKALTLQSLRRYLAYYEENRLRLASFTPSARVDISPGGGYSVFDAAHRLFCMDDKLKKLIFDGRAVKRFTIREDGIVIYEGTPQGLVHTESDTATRAQALASQAAMVQLERRMEREQRGHEEQMHRQKGNGRAAPPPRLHSSPHVEFKEPFQKYYIDIEMEHPYYPLLFFTHSGPRIDHDNPDINDYLNEYEEESGLIRRLAEALMMVAFPGVGLPQPAVPAAPAVDAVTEIRLFKELLDAGALTQKEFDAKKKQLLGL